MSLCTGGGTKKNIRWSQAVILATLDVADKLKILLFEFIFFDIKTHASFIANAFRVHRPLRTGYYDLTEKDFSETGTSGPNGP